MSTDEASGVPRRYEIDPDPAWDGSDDQDGVLTVVLSWVPDPLVGRPPELAASPELVAALLADGLTGFITGPARATYDEDAFDGAGVMTPPELVRLIVGGDPAADFFYGWGEGLVVSERALALLQTRCRNLTVRPTDEPRPDMLSLLGWQLPPVISRE
ncbi:hypothetical protein ACWT_5932 [Actinoplanes sp. SE50]|uniref:hypothetical protein n=1 Tax=unclassified Actinoplanes TaxID=2626549 RepID=UPI00023EC164|nr:MULTISPECIES: hypothetical protein [unclassified Actinoplanes]AEV86951.1 hypothetical protein ACPL_6064 [Actinoplanes sp. SE50/110]ATO85347.1 hypothetical protein ACWT_5932 [Actinoplanes sp. SE50]SLM02758.1 hypothetical protein ACSP50_6043 [Actinoplanes sp. SE50/110]